MIPPQLADIFSRHEARLKACGDKLMGAERDLSVVLGWVKIAGSALEDAYYYVPGAEVGDMEGQRLRDKVSKLMHISTRAEP